MSVAACEHEGRRDEILVAYLYDDLEPAEREAFASHLAQCAVCWTELADLQSVRANLARWTPPEPARVLTFTPQMPRRARLWSALADVPAWAQVAAALLVVGIAASIANLHLQYNRDGFSVRTGWMAQAPSLDAGPSVNSGAAPDLPWRAELAALERTLRAEVQSATAAAERRAAQGGGSDAELLRRVRALIEASERTQRRELALRVAEVARDVQAQRYADLQRIQRNLNVIENATGGAIVRQGKLLNNLAVRVSQQQ